MGNARGDWNTMDVRAVLAVWGMVIGLAVTPSLAGSMWETDFEKAAASAKASHRYMLLDFSGSDWCGWCIKLEDEVFSKKDFKNYAKESLVCVLLDFPRRKSLKKALSEQNRALATKYQVRGYPSVVILSPDGDVVARTGYKAGGPEEYVKHLKASIDPHRQANSIPDPTAAMKGQLTKPRTTLPNITLSGPLAEDANRDVRTWTATSGASLVASAVRERGANLILKKEDGTFVEIRASRLSSEDRHYIEDLKKKEAPQHP